MAAGVDRDLREVCRRALLGDEALRLPVDEQAQGLDKVLLGCAVDRCLKAIAQVAACALIVEVKDANANRFHEHYGFTPLADGSMTLLCGGERC